MKEQLLRRSQESMNKSQKLSRRLGLQELSLKEYLIELDCGRKADGIKDIFYLCLLEIKKGCYSYDEWKNDYDEEEEWTFN